MWLKIFHSETFLSFRFVFSTSQCCLCQSVSQCFILCLLFVRVFFRGTSSVSHTSEHLMSTSCTLWCTILIPLSTLWVYHAQNGAQLSHLWTPYEYIRHNMVHNSHTSEHLMSTSCTIWCTILTPLSTLWVHHAQYGAQFSHLWAPYEYTMHNLSLIHIWRCRRWP